MKELVKISESGKGNPVVNARELHAFLDAKQDFSSWLKARFKKYGFIENTDYARVLFDVNGKKIPLPKNREYDIADLRKVFRIEYALTLDCAKELSMVQNNAKGKEARQYFIEVEKRYKVLKAEKEVKVEAKPITFTMSEVAEKLSLSDYYGKIGRNELFRILHFHKILNDEKQPLNKYVKSGYFVGKPIKVTEDGLKWLNQKFCIQKTNNTTDNSSLIALITELQSKQKLADEKQNLMIEGVATIVETLYFNKGGKRTDEQNRQSLEHLQIFLGKAKNQQKAIG